MKTNQAFTILQNAGGVRAARIIVENTSRLGAWRVWRYAAALRRGVPVAKIIRQKWFFGLKFRTNAHTLDPRPDTETLVSAALADVAPDASLRVLDIGTGTGCIIMSVAANRKNITGIGIDISSGARRVARYNAKKLGLDTRVRILRADFRKPRCISEKFDIIVANPPYIARDDTRVDAGAMHDPKIALYADSGGLGAYHAIAKNARHWIKNGGRIYLEIGVGQSRAVRKIFTGCGWGFVRAEKDLSGITRVLVFAKNGI